MLQSKVKVIKTRMIIGGAIACLVILAVIECLLGRIAKKNQEVYCPGKPNSSKESAATRLLGGMRGPDGLYHAQRD